jgi:hypothetical protein
MPIVISSAKDNPRETATAGRMTRRMVIGAVAIGVSLVAPVFGVVGAAPASAAVAAPTLTTSTTADLAADQPIKFTVQGVPAGTALLAVQCTPQALTQGEDACGNRRNVLVFADSSGVATGTFVPSPVIQTTLGTVDCTQASASCLFGVASIAGDGSDSVIGAELISFAPGVTGSSPSGRSTEPAAPSRVASSVPISGPVIVGGRPLTQSVVAGLAPRLASTGAITGPELPAPSRAAPRHPVAGQGIIEVTLEAPKTSWESATQRAVVVDVSVDGGPSQQIVCFAGASPFTYAGFTGTLSTGSHMVTVAVDTELSNTGTLAPTVRLAHLQLEVVAPSNPWYDRIAFAPVVYGRADTAQEDTPLLTYADQSAGRGGVRTLSYTTIWSKEEAGTSFVPFLEWGEWGRMTDITQTVALDVGSGGAISNETYDTCGCVGTPATENEVSVLEEEVPFSGSYFEQTHAIVRNASGNDYQSESGTTAFRIQQVPVAGPAPDADRDAVMDANPWTYLISAQETTNWYTNGTADPASPEIGDSRQYAIVDLRTKVNDVSATAVGIQLSGSSQWYSSDYGSGFPLQDGGHGRTAVKLPLDWEDRTITGLKVLYYPSGPEPSVRDVAVRVLGLTRSYAVEYPAFPRVQIEAAAVPSVDVKGSNLGRRPPSNGSPDHHDHSTSLVGVDGGLT